MLLAAVLPSVRAAQAAGLLAFFGLFFIAGGGPPPAVMPDWMIDVGDALPMTYLVRAVQSHWIGTGWEPTALLVLAIGAIGSVRLARP